MRTKSYKDNSRMFYSVKMQLRTSYCRTKNQSKTKIKIFCYFLKNKIQSSINKLFRDLAKRQHKGRFLTRVDSMKGLTPKKTEKTREIQGFTTSKAKFTTGRVQKSNSREKSL